MMQSLLREVSSSHFKSDTGNDTVWAASFLRSLLDAWLDASLTSSGIFHSDLDRQWRKKENATATLVSQCRLIYNFSRGYEVFHDARYANAAARGVNALNKFFTLSNGSYCWAVAQDGAQIDLTSDSYGLAFAILALSTAAKALGKPTLVARAMSVWRWVDDSHADEDGGYLWRLGFADDLAQERSQNPMMHLLEALMALSEVDASGQAREAAWGVLNFMRTLPGFERGRVIEMYAADWKPQPKERGGILNIGHQFEWALLLSDWHALDSDPWALAAGRAFLETGLRLGLDHDGGVVEACALDGAVAAPQKELWPQCEAIRAMRRYARAHHTPEAAEAMQRTLSFYRQNFIDREHGGLIASLATATQPARMDKGDCWKLDYHSVNMCLELIASSKKH